MMGRTSPKGTRGCVTWSVPDQEEGARPSCALASFVLLERPHVLLTQHALPGPLCSIARCPLSGHGSSSVLETGRSSPQATTLS